MTQYFISIDNTQTKFSFRIQINNQQDIDLAERNIAYVLDLVRQEIPVHPQTSDVSPNPIEGIALT